MRFTEMDCKKDSFLEMGEEITSMKEGTNERSLYLSGRA